MYYSQSDFEIVFIAPVISQISCIKGGRVGGGWGGVVRVSGKPEAGKTCH